MESENRQHLSETERLRLLEQALATVGRAAAVEEVCAAVVEALTGALGYDAAAVHLLQPPASELHLLGARGVPQDVLEEMVILDPGDDSDQGTQSNRALFLQDCHGNTCPFPAWLAASQALLPLSLNGTAIGAIRLGALTRRGFSEEERALLHLVASLTAQAIGRVQAHDMRGDHASSGARLDAITGTRLQSEAEFRSLFESSPLALFEEDYSVIKCHVDELAACGISDVGEYLRTHPTIADKWRHECRLVNMNKAALELFEASSVDDFLARLDYISGGNATGAYIAVWDAMARGETDLRYEQSQRTCNGRVLHLIETCTIPEAHLGTWDRLITANVDITDLKSAQMERSRVERDLIHRTEELGVLLQASQTLASTLHYDGLLQLAARTAGRALRAGRCALWRFDPPSREEELVALWTADGSRPVRPQIGDRYGVDDFPEDVQVIGTCVPARMRADDRSVSEQYRRYMMETGRKSALLVPLRHAGEVFGTLSIGDDETSRVFGDEEVDLAVAIADQMATALANATLHRRVQQQAITDELTGVYNYRYFYDRLDQEISRARRYDYPVSLLIVDIDDFKAVNDEHGHRAGDEVLVAVASLVRQNVRAGIDLVARYGGEEFVVLLPNVLSGPAAEPGGAGIVRPQVEIECSMARGASSQTGSGTSRRTPAEMLSVGPQLLEDEPADTGPQPPGPEAAAVGERIRRLVAARHYPLSGLQGPATARISVSVGAACWPQDCGDGTELVSRADIALYAAKRAGKNSVRIFNENRPVEESTVEG